MDYPFADRHERGGGDRTTGAAMASRSAFWSAWAHCSRNDAALARRILAIALVLLVASCSGGGCSGGCTACGTTPLPNGFPQPETIENAAAIRVTRPGLTFLQENLATLTEQALGQNTVGGVASFPIPPSNGSGFQVCPGTNPPPPKCTAEINVGSAKLRINSITPHSVKLDGSLPVRIRDLPVTLISIIPGYVVMGEPTLAPSGDLCQVPRGSSAFPYKEVPLNVELPIVVESRTPRAGYTKVDIQNAVIEIGITENDVDICHNCTAPGCPTAIDFAKNAAFNSLLSGVEQQIKDGLSSAFCAKPTPGANPPCPVGSAPDNPDPAKAKCVWNGGTECMPSLLGLDGHVALATAFASFSPSTQGGLDFVLASGGNMNPAPSVAGVPAWAPRNPPVPAEDNNANGISLALRGGTVPEPKSDCVQTVRRPPPQGIPIPTELLANSVAPWPAGTAGPHLGIALAGRFVDHALLGAYNSGALCLSVSTDVAEQLNSGYLSLLIPSIKTLAFEQLPAAAALVTRPAAPPSVTIGGGTDVDADPLLTLHLERFALDFYVFSHDRFVRVFTYTADLAVPVNLQTGKDPERNPNGGILPVLGNIRVTNAAVENDVLVFEDAPSIASGITGLLGGIVSQFLGGGLGPIDLSTALASVGLTLDVPAGGIRKLTSGSDDFLAIFANLAKAPAAAREEADTRATLVEKIVDPSAMGLATASRPRFPKLRVRVESVASRPTEHTWWIDRGTHAAWTQDHEIVVDQDAMLLQGRHVLSVSSRIVGDMGSEDATPTEIPFVIDTLPPHVSAERRGSQVEVSAWDFVSKGESLLARHRAATGDFTEWTPIARGGRFEAPNEDPIDVEVKDEEGNIGRVRLGLRGRADPTLSAGGSGCGCRAAPRLGWDRTGLASLAALGALTAIAARRRRAGSIPSQRDKQA